MGFIEDQAHARAVRAHLEDRISMGDPEAICMQCRAKKVSVMLAFGIVGGLVVIVAVKRSRANRGS